MSSVRPRVEIFSLLNFKRLAENEANHADLLSDRRILQYVERGLETSDEEVLKTSLRILELLSDNPKSCEMLKKMDSLKTTVKSLLERKFGVDVKMKSKAEKIIRTLDGTKPVSKEKLTWPRKILTFQITGLHSGTRKELEDILTKKVKGVLTVFVDVEHQRCVVTVYSHIEIKELAEKIMETGYFFPHQVIRNNRNQEILIPLFNDTRTPDPQILPEYLDEEDDEEPINTKAVKQKDFRVTASQWFLTTAGIIQKSMYW